MSRAMQSSLFLLCLMCLQLTSSMLQGATVLNDRPVVAILSQEYWGHYGDLKPASHSYIAASYVKYIEGAGGRVLPVLLDQQTSYYEQVIRLTNGLLLPGGGQHLDGTGAYEREGRLLLSLAKKTNDAGEHYPVWGTCLGFELMGLHESGENILSSCDSHDQALPLEFVNDSLIINTSKLFHSLSLEQMKILSTKNVTFNFHRKCITKESFENTRLKDTFNILSMNKDKNGKEFISSFESKKYPMYGVQFHPEKNIYEFVNQKELYTQIPHDSEAIAIAQYFGNFFVNQCRLNNHTWSENFSQNFPLIYSFKPEHTIDYENFEQMYFFQRSAY